MYERFIARQPIFDERLKVFAYELLFRAGPQNIFQPRKDASSSVIVDSATPRIQKNGAVEFSTAPVELFSSETNRQAAASASTAAM